MNIIKSISKSADKINNFLTSDKKEIELRFIDGLFLKIIKHTTEDKQELEVHTSGYDGIMEGKEAIEWIKWELIDLKANGIEIEF